MNCSGSSKAIVSEACQINDLDHVHVEDFDTNRVSEACQINDLDHLYWPRRTSSTVSEACQINDLDHCHNYGEWE